MKHIGMKAIAMLCGIMASGWLFAQDHAGWQNKVDERLLISSAAGVETEFIVVMSERADVQGAYRLRTKEEKGAFVYQKLKETADRTQKRIRAILDAAGVPYQAFFMVNAILVQGNAALMEQIAALPEVQAIRRNSRLINEKPVEVLPDVNRKVQAVEWGISMVNADDVWALGFTGQNVVVAGADVGVDWDHPALINHYRGWDGANVNHDYNWFDAVKNAPGSTSCGYDSPEPCGDGSHGTHTIGTICGDDGAGNQIGMAPGAKWIAARNMDDGNGTLSLYVSCFQWFLAPTKIDGTGADPAKAPHVINNSWGCPTSEGCDATNYNIMEQAVLNCRAAGIVVVVSAGNSGSNCNTIGNPAIFEGSFAVGSSTSADDISGFSSRGSAQSGGVERIKPDVVAPGSSIRSAANGGGYTSMSGTSMAGPHVAGAVALLISAKPSLAGQVDSIEAILERTAVRKTTTQDCSGTPGTSIPNNTWGWGRIDLLAAVEDVLDRAPAADFKVDATSGCNSLTVNFTDNSSFDPTAWSWDFGDGQTSVQQNPTHTYNTAGTYTVKLVATNAIGNDTATRSNLIKVGMGNPWPAQNVGAADTSIGSGGLHGSPGFGLFFDANKDLVIQSVKVYAGSAGNREIAVLDGEGGTVLSSFVVSLVPGEQRATVNLEVPAGTGRFLQMLGTTDLYRNSSGPVYPYTINGLVSITGSNAGTAGYYYYFYDWEVREAGCDGTIGLEEKSRELSFRIVPNPTAGSFHIKLFTPDGGQNAQVTVLDVLGRRIAQSDMPLHGGEASMTLHPDLKKGIYFIHITHGDRMGIEKLIVE